MPNEYEVTLSDGGSYKVTLDRPLAEGESINDVISEHEGSFAKQLPKSDPLSEGDTKLLTNAINPQLKGISTTTQDAITEAIKTTARTGTYLGASLAVPATIPAQALAGLGAFGANVGLGLEEPSVMGAGTAAAAPALATGAGVAIRGGGQLLRRITPLTKAASGEMIDIANKVIGKGAVPEGLAKGLYAQFDKISNVRIPIANYVAALEETLANKQYTTEPGVRSLATQLQNELKDVKFGAPASFLQDKLIELGSKTGISPAKQVVGNRLQKAIWDDLRGAESEVGKLKGEKGQLAAQTAKEAINLLTTANKAFRQDMAIKELQETAKEATSTTKWGYDYLNVGRILDKLKDTEKNKFLRESFPPDALKTMEETFKQLRKAPEPFVSPRSAILGAATVATGGFLFLPQLASKDVAEGSKEAGLVAAIVVGAAMTPPGAKILMQSLAHGPYLTRQQVMLLGSTLRAYNSDAQGEADRVKEAMKDKDISFEEKVRMAEGQA